MERVSEFLKNNKEKILLTIIFIVLTLLISIPYLNNDLIMTHDLSYHLNRVNSIYEELKMGHFPVLIHSNLIEGFGYLNSIFYPEIFLYIPAVLMLCGVKLVPAYKVLIVVMNLATVLIAYYSAHTIFKDKKKTLAVTILYSTAYYRLTDTYIRGAIGESLAMTFLPLVIAGLYEIIFGENKKWYLIGLGVLGVISSHVLSFGLVICLILSICVLNLIRILKDKKKISAMFLAGIFAIIMTLSYILPFIEQSLSDQFNVDMKIYSPQFVQDSACSIEELFSNNINGPVGYQSLGTIIPFIAIIVFLFINRKKTEKVGCLLKTKTEKDYTLTYMKQIALIGFGLLVITTNYIPWDKIVIRFSILITMQFIYRLNILTSVLLSFASGYVIGKIFEKENIVSNILYLIILTLVLGWTTHLLQIAEVKTVRFKSVEEILDYAPVGNGEYLPIGTNVSQKEVKNKQTDKVYEFERNNGKIEFRHTKDDGPLDIHVPLIYYKGYVSYIVDDNGNKTDLNVIEDLGNRNVIVRAKTTDVLEGTVVVKYQITKYKVIGDILTYGSLLGLVYYLCFYKKHRELKRIGNASN